MSSVLYQSLHSPILVDHGPLSWFCFEKPRSQTALYSIKTRPYAARKNRSGYFTQSFASHSNFPHIFRHAMWRRFHNCDVRNDCHCAWAAGAAAALVVVVVVVVVRHRPSLGDVVVLLIGGGRLISAACRDRARVGLSRRVVAAPLLADRSRPSPSRSATPLALAGPAQRRAQSRQRPPQRHRPPAPSGRSSSRTKRGRAHCQRLTILPAELYDYIFVHQQAAPLHFHANCLQRSIWLSASMFCLGAVASKATQSTAATGATALPAAAYLRASSCVVRGVVVVA